MTTYDVGSGHTYSNLAAVAAVINGTTLSADAFVDLYGTVTDSAQVAFSSITTGAFGVYIRSAAGQKFADSPLRYGVSGARWTTTYNGGKPLTVASTVGKFEFLDLQLEKTSSANSDHFIEMLADSLNLLAMRRCIVEVNGDTLACVNARRLVMEDVALVGRGGYMDAGVLDGGLSTLVNTGLIDLNSGGTGSRVGINNSGGGSFPTTVTNVYAFGFATDATGSFSGSYCATDKAGGSSGLPSTNRQASAVPATELVDAAGSDYDLTLNASSAALKANGTASGAPANDINDDAWNGGTPDIGPVRFPSGGGSSIVPILNSYRQRRI